MAIFHCIALKAWWFNARCRLKRSSESLLSTLRLYGTRQPPRRLGRWTFPCARTNMLGRSTTWPCAPPLSLGHRSPVKILLYGHNSSYYFFTNNIFFHTFFERKKKNIGYTDVTHCAAPCSLIGRCSSTTYPHHSVLSLDRKVVHYYIQFINADHV